MKTKLYIALLFQSLLFGTISGADDKQDAEIAQNSPDTPLQYPAFGKFTVVPRKARKKRAPTRISAGKNSKAQKSAEASLKKQTAECKAESATPPSSSNAQ